MTRPLGFGVAEMSSDTPDVVKHQLLLRGGKEGGG